MEPPVPRSSVYRVEGVYRLILHQGGCPGVLRGQKAGDGVLLEAEAIERGEVLRRWDAVEWLRSQPRREAMAEAGSAAPKT